MTKVKQLQLHDTHIAEIAIKCKPYQLDKTLYFMDLHGIVCKKKKMDKKPFIAILVQTLQCYILYENHNALRHNGSTHLYNFIKRHYYWKRLHQHFNKYVRSCPECQQVNLKECPYIGLHLPTLEFCSMDILGQYCETESRNQSTLTVMCMLTNFVFMISIRSKTMKEVITAYLKQCVLHLWG